MAHLKDLLVGHFLSFDLWLEAKKLLDYQINDKLHFKTYNTLNFHYFEQIKSKTNSLGKKNYFEKKITNNLFYGLEREFFFHKYTVPKIGIGLRNYTFFSYPIQILNYTFGLYLLRLTQQYLIDSKNPKIKSFYGGDLKFNLSNNKLILNKNTTLYYKHYSSFKNELIQEASKPSNKYIIRLDIQNYFDNISIKKLLHILSDKIKPSDIKSCNFDTSTKEQIDFFFRFMGKGHDNIPQSDNNIISNFISHLYLTFGDFIIEDIINELNKNYSDIIEDFKIIRYVDDIYISLKFKAFTIFNIKFNQDPREDLIYNLLNTLSDDFYKKLGLRFNKKAETFKIQNKEERERFLDLIKKVSEDYPVPGSDDTFSVPEKANRLIILVSKIGKRKASSIYQSLPKEESETLKDVYNKSVLSFLSKPKVLAQLEHSFILFNFNLLRVYPKPLIILATLSPKIKTRLQKYFLDQKILNTFDRSSLVVFLCQTNFSSKPLYKKLGLDEQLVPILHFMKLKKVIDNKNTGYYSIEINKMKLLASQVSYVEQIRQRVYAEKKGEFSTSLNHLLNEIQLACCILEDEDIKTYKSSNVKNYLTTKRLDSTTKTKISNLFDRRNNNPISHSGSDSRVAWAVEEKEYLDYKSYVATALNTILS